MTLTASAVSFTSFAGVRPLVSIVQPDIEKTGRQPASFQGGKLSACARGDGYDNGDQAKSQLFFHDMFSLIF
jgi:hypothetical protein